MNPAEGRGQLAPKRHGQHRWVRVVTCALRPEARDDPLALDAIGRLEDLVGGRILSAHTVCIDCEQRWVGDAVGPCRADAIEAGILTRGANGTRRRDERS